MSFKKSRRGNYHYNAQNGFNYVIYQKPDGWNWLVGDETEFSPSTMQQKSYVNELQQPNFLTKDEATIDMVKYLEETYGNTIRYTYLD